MKNAVICGYVRTPFTPANKGQLAKVRPDDLAAAAVKGLLAKTGVKAEDVEDLLLGCAFPEGEQGLNMGRIVTFLAGLPEKVGGVTINRFCGSSMEAIHSAAGKIAIGAGEVFVCAGVESMTRVPMTGFNPLPNPALYARMPQVYMSMGLTAEKVAEQCNISRHDMEEFALTSHQKAAKADFSEEIVPVSTPTNISTPTPTLPLKGEGGDAVRGAGGGQITQDGCIRADTSLEALESLYAAFKEGGRVTAGTSSPLTDGAAAVLVCSEEYAKKNKLPMLARIKATAVVGLDPEVMGLGPIEATKKALERAGLKIDQIDLAEINEAFAAQAIPCMAQIGIDPAKVNMEGGAIALGHPLGASGARITGKAALLLHRHKKKYALATMCIGGGQGIATVLEAV